MQLGCFVKLNTNLVTLNTNLVNLVYYFPTVAADKFSVFTLRQGDVYNSPGIMALE